MEKPTASSIAFRHQQEWVSYRGCYGDVYFKIEVLLFSKRDLCFNSIKAWFIISGKLEVFQCCSVFCNNNSASQRLYFISNRVGSLKHSHPLVHRGSRRSTESKRQMKAPTKKVNLVTYSPYRHSWRTFCYWQDFQLYYSTFTTIIFYSRRRPVRRRDHVAAEGLSRLGRIDIYLPTQVTDHSKAASRPASCFPLLPIVVRTSDS